jgi:type I restriction-modification system DNA methylase subunit
LNDKEACSLILMMELLNKNGTCIAVLKEGVFFDNKYANIRKCLIDNYNVYKVTSIPNNTFENTTTKTSILFF